MSSWTPTEQELETFIVEYGAPVRLSVGDHPPVILGWVERDDTMVDVAGLLREAADYMDGDEW